MKLAFRQLKVYVRSVLLTMVAVAVFLILWNNRKNEVSFWFFGLTKDAQPVNVVWLVLGTAVCTLVVRWIGSLTFGLVRDWRELSKLREVQLAAEAQARREKEIKQQEQRLDEKLKQVSQINAGDDKEERV